jgi:hypothetical protein
MRDCVTGSLRPSKVRKVLDSREHKCKSHCYATEPHKSILGGIIIQYEAVAGTCKREKAKTVESIVRHQTQ